MAHAPAVKAVPVREHRFDGPEYLVGIEEELMLLDPDTLALAPGVEPVVGAAHDPHVKPEFLQCQVEIATTPQATTTAALAELRELRRDLADAAAASGLVVAGAGTHPFSLAEEQAITARDRYRELLAALRYPVRREACFGMHVHVSVAGPDKAVQVMEALVADLPLLAALSTSSPFWRGEPTGLHSTRAIVFASMPRSGLPPRFADYEDYASTLELLRAAEAVADHSYLWWDVRPHPRFGTVEVRVMDVQPRVDDAGAIAGLVQALVHHHGRRLDDGEEIHGTSRTVAAENRWLAARHGIHARLVDPSLGRAIPARDAIRRLLDRLEADAEAVGAGASFDRIARILEEGTSADRQLRVSRRGGTLHDVMAHLVGESAA